MAISVEPQRLSPVAEPRLTKFPRFRPAAARSGAILTAIGLALMLLSWQAVPLVPADGLDASWTAGLAMAVHTGVPFGSRAIFTYGPLGFLTYPFLWYSGLGLAAFIYNLIFRFLLCLALYLGARRTFGSVVSFLIVAAVASISNKEIEPIVVLIAMVAALMSDLSPRRTLSLAVAAGAISGFELLNKISVGVTLAAMTLVFVLCVPLRRRLAVGAAAAALVVVLFIFWLATGQHLAALPDYVKNSIQIVSGYSAAMSLAIPGLGWQGAAAVLALLLGVWGALHTASGAGMRQRVGVVLLWVAFWFFLFKEGFVRHDSGHAVTFFDSLPGAFLAFRWRPGYRLPALACLGCLVALALAAEGQSFGSDFDPTRNVDSTFTQIHDVASSGRRQALIDAGRAGIKSSEPIDGNLLPLLYGHTVAIYPTEIALAWAYQLKWDPVPVLQSYSAYTTSLDEFDAKYLTSRLAPQRILFRDDPAIDGRVLSFDQGQTIRTMLCRYYQIMSKPPLTVLRLGPNRCSAPTLLAKVRADWGQSVQVPPNPNNHSLVFVRVNGAGVGGLERLQALLLKPAARSIVLNGQSSFRLVPGTASDGLPLRASPGMDYSSPFNIAVNAKTIAVLKQGQTPSQGHPLTFLFYAETFAAPARGS